MGYFYTKGHPSLVISTGEPFALLGFSVLLIGGAIGNFEARHLPVPEAMLLIGSGSDFG